MHEFFFIKKIFSDNLLSNIKCSHGIKFGSGWWDFCQKFQKTFLENVKMEDSLQETACPIDLENHESQKKVANEVIWS